MTLAYNCRFEVCAWSCPPWL